MDNNSFKWVYNWILRLLFLAALSYAASDVPDQQAKLDTLIALIAG